MPQSELSKEAWELFTQILQRKLLRKEQFPIKCTLPAVPDIHQIRHTLLKLFLEDSADSPIIKSTKLGSMREKFLLDSSPSNPKYFTFQFQNEQLCHDSLK